MNEAFLLLHFLCKLLESKFCRFSTISFKKKRAERERTLTFFQRFKRERSLAAFEIGKIVFDPASPQFTVQPLPNAWHRSRYVGLLHPLDTL